MTLHATEKAAGRRGRGASRRMPERKQGKNRLHLDVWVEQSDSSLKRHALVEAEAERLIALGAKHLRTRDDDGDFSMVMEDPEGNEFCIA